MLIIMVMVKGEEVDCIVGLEIGVDDYILKLFNLCELLVCICVVLCCQVNELLGVLLQEEVVIVFGKFKFNFGMCEMFCEDELMLFISGEFVVLKVLVSYLCELFFCDKLMNFVCGCEYFVMECFIDVQILCLCCMVEEDLVYLCYIQIVWGLGYVFVLDGFKV